MYNHQLLCTCCIPTWPIPHCFLPISFMNIIIIYADKCISRTPNCNPNAVPYFGSSFGLTNVNPFNSKFVYPVLLDDVVCVVGVLIVELSQSFVNISCLQEVGPKKKSETGEQTVCSFSIRLKVDPNSQKDSNANVAECRYAL